MSGALGMAHHMMQNPEAIREMTNSPIVQSLLNNPDIIRSLIADNPQIQQVIEVIFFISPSHFYVNEGMTRKDGSPIFLVAFD